MHSLDFIAERLVHKLDPILFMYMKNIPNKEKFKQLQFYYLTNPFLTKEQIENGFSLFEKIQHTYWMLKRFVFIWRLHKARHNINKQDLYFNELSSLAPQYKINLLHCGTLYNFRLTDLLHIFSTALTNSQSLNPDPKWPNNPYTGLPFTRADIYATYFKLKAMYIFIPYYFHLFIQWDLSIKKFKYELFPLLKDHAINNYLLDSTDEVLLFDIVHMVKSLFDDTRSISTEKMNYQSKKKVVQTLKPYLEKYLYGTLSCNRHKKINVVGRLKKN